MERSIISNVILLFILLNLVECFKVDLHTAINFKGRKQVVEVDAKHCTKLSGGCRRGQKFCYNFNKLTASIDSKGHCVRLYDQDDCLGSSLAIYKGSTFHYNLQARFFLDRASSIGPCFPQNCKHRTGKRRKRQPGGCVFVQDLMYFGVLPGAAPANPVAPIITYRRGYGGRVESLRAVVRRQNLDHGSAPTRATRSYAQRLGRRNDDAGHIIARRLGGRGDIEYNIFPQNRNFNRGVWAQQEAIVYNAAARGQAVTLVYNFIYDSPTATRPSSFFYSFHFPDGTVLFNDIINP